jgi:hypothetical protein
MIKNFHHAFQDLYISYYFIYLKINGGILLFCPRIIQYILLLKILNDIFRKDKHFKILRKNIISFISIL